MMSQPGKQTITIHILPNISESKSNQIMKFGQFIEYNKKNIFLLKLCRKCGTEAGSRSIFANGLQLSFNIFLIALTLDKSKLYKL